MLRPRHLSLIALFMGLLSDLAAQTQAEMLQAAKAELAKERGSENIQKARELLERLAGERPEDPEVHYFLGTAYSRLNAPDGSEMISVTLDGTIRCSEEFETVIKLQPRYKGEIIASDPYSRLSAVWSSLAMAYRYHGQTDSAQWAYREGKLRGAFGAFLLEVCRTALINCDSNAFLFSFGDNYTFPLWYLQFMEGVRTDVEVVDLSLLNTGWYPDFLGKDRRLYFGNDPAYVDTVTYADWKPAKVTVGGFSWEVAPTFEDQYLLRGNLLLLKLLETNNFRDPVYFTWPPAPTETLGLHHYCQDLVVTGKFDRGNRNSAAAFEKSLRTYLPLASLVNANSELELVMVDHIRVGILDRVSDALRANHAKDAERLMSLYELYVSEKRVPEGDAEVTKYAQLLRDAM